ncbi:LIM domain-binding protein 3-like isoform X7 [Scylla paramamosain]|uniref:LIM domain-binding protein 3-like isoform X7 n=1 Tax=Scylla paramamosain TaxID=85552 RepID=UPI0030826CAA
MAGVIELILERDGHDQPWGFRLQGGADLAMPLSVQRVLVGTPADGMLRKGDVITRISCTETKNITHQQAADLFNSAGNQIAVQLKRAGVQSAPVASASTSAPLVNGSPVPTPVPVPVSGGVPLPGIANPTLARSENPAVKALPKTQFSLKTHFAKQQKPQPTNLDTLSIQTQVTGTLQHIQQAQNTAAATPQLPPGIQVKQYNTPLPLYSQENVQEAIKMQASHGMSPINPSSNTANKPAQVILTPSKEYNPQTSATWRALQETDPAVDPEKIANYSSLKEHDPIYSEVYKAPAAPKPGQRPPPRTNAQPGPRSPVADLLPSALRPAGEGEVSPPPSVVSPDKSGASAVLSATLAESKPINHQMTQDPVKIPMYETNSIGGRKRIAQTASFNKLMMEVLGE